jgi:2-dehydropantoate 2-reductase
MSLMIGLEASGWSMGKFRKGNRIRIATEAAREALGIAARHHQVSPPWWRPMLSAWTVGVLMSLARKFIPLPLEQYFKFHFTKVGAQTRLYASSYLKLGQMFNLPTEAILKNIGGLKPHKAD